MQVPSSLGSSFPILVRIHWPLKVPLGPFSKCLDVMRVLFALPHGQALHLGNWSLFWAAAKPADPSDQEGQWWEWGSFWQRAMPPPSLRPGTADQTPCPLRSGSDLQILVWGGPQPPAPEGRMNPAPSVASLTQALPISQRVSVWALLCRPSEPLSRPTLLPGIPSPSPHLFFQVPLTHNHLSESLPSRDN